MPVHPACADAVALFLAADREWEVSQQTGHLMRWDMVACEVVWRMMGIPVGSPRVASVIEAARAIAAHAQAEANRLIGARLERDRRRRDQERPAHGR
ncbi:hypothetical protein [Roseospira visakhapatnamensis]|uniref:Uncharacterized protein n=1 Tax=Roseospira visakhapatnamensis TaxID=390880 RepID=A0A7W6RGJ4_9PROT|nr:hypothetical protein [Roseospira visakhapatnamensis]MBB4268148.1 hypothetical protein [Roseospira visakhapatnamensis]